MRLCSHRETVWWWRALGCSDDSAASSSASRQAPHLYCTAIMMSLTPMGATRSNRRSLPGAQDGHHLLHRGGLIAACIIQAMGEKDAAREA